MNRELSKKAKLSISKAVFVPILTYGHESWVMTERVRSQVQASEMRFLRKIEGVTLLNRVRSSEIRKSLNIEPLLFRIERSQLKWMVRPCKQNASGKTPQTSFTCQSKWEKTSWTTEDYTWTDYITWMEPLGTSPKQNDEFNGRP